MELSRRTMEDPDMTTNDAAMNDFRCAVHDRPLVGFCPVCRGTRGGLITTPRKVRGGGEKDPPGQPGGSSLENTAQHRC
jgi:hypothetical protein